MRISGLGGAMESASSIFNQIINIGGKGVEVEKVNTGYTSTSRKDRVAQIIFQLSK